MAISGRTTVAHLAVTLLLLVPIVMALMPAAVRAANARHTELLPFQLGEMWGYRRANGIVVIAPQFHVANAFTPEGTASVASDDGWTIIDRSGNVLLQPLTVDNWPDEFSDGVARFVEDGKIGFFDRAGRKVIAATFDAAHPFSEGLAAVCRGCREETDGEHLVWAGGLWGYIDASGELVIPARFEDARPFSYGEAEVRVDQRWLHIGIDGKPVQSDHLACKFKTEENRVELAWDGTENADLVVDDGRRPRPLACKMPVEAARFVETEPAAPRYVFEFDGADCRAMPHAAAGRISSHAVLVIYPAHGNRGTLFWSDITIMDECEFVQFAPTAQAKVKSEPEIEAGCADLDKIDCPEPGDRSEAVGPPPFEGAWVPGSPAENAELCAPVREDAAEGDFVILESGRLITGAGFGCRIEEIEEKPSETFHLRLHCGGSNKHFVGGQRARISLESPDHMTFLFEGQEMPLSYTRCHR